LSTSSISLYLFMHSRIIR